MSVSRYILLHGDYTPNEKISTILKSKVSALMGRDSWVKLFNENPSVLTGYDVAVLFKTTTDTTIPFMFEVLGGNYEIILRCFAATRDPASGKAQLDSQEVKDWATAPAYTVYQQNITLYSNTPLTSGLHKLVITYVKPIALIDLTIRNTDGSEEVVVQAVHTFLFPNKIQNFPRTNQPEYIIPALNTRIYGVVPTPGPVVPYTGTPNPLTCFEPTDTPLTTSNPILLLSGAQTLQQKLDIANQVRTYCGRNQWVKFINTYPDIVSGQEVAVIINSAETPLTFRFAIPTGLYNIVIRCIMPSANTDSGYVRLDSFPEQMFTRAYGPGKWSTNQFNFLLYEKLKLENGYHQLVFTSREPMAYLFLVINRVDRQFQDIIIPASETITNPNKIYGTPDYLATFTPPVFTTIPPTTTMMPTTTSAPKVVVAATGSHSVSSLINGYRYYTFTGSGSIKLNMEQMSYILLVGSGGKGAVFGKTSKAVGGGGSGGAGGLAYGSILLAPNSIYTINVSPTTTSSITGNDIYINASQGNIGSNGSASSTTGYGGQGGSAGKVVYSGSRIRAIKTIINESGDNGLIKTRGYGAGGKGGGTAYKWIDSVTYGGGGVDNTNSYRYGMGGAGGSPGGGTGGAAVLVLAVYVG